MKPPTTTHPDDAAHPSDSDKEQPMPEQLTLFDPDPLLDKRQVAQCLNVGPRFVERLIAEKRIPYVKVGRHVRIRLSEIEGFIGQQTVRQS